MTQRNIYVSYAVWSGKQAASRLDRTNMAVLIVEGRLLQFATTYSYVKLCYVTSLVTALYIPIIFCFNHAKCFNLSKHRRDAVPDIFVILLHHAHSINTTLWHRIGEAQTDCQHTIIWRGLFSWRRLSVTINVLCHSTRPMCLQWRGLNQFIQSQGKGGAP